MFFTSRIFNLKVIFLAICCFLFSCGNTRESTVHNESSNELLPLLKNYEIKENYIFVVTGFDCGECVSEINVWLNNNPTKQATCLYFSNDTVCQDYNLNIVKTNKMKVIFFNNIEIIKKLSGMTNNSNGPFLMELNGNELVKVEKISYLK